MAMRRLGQILVDLGFITDDQLEQLLEEHQASPGILLGKFAESQNLINEEQLSQALIPKIGGGRCAAHELLVCNSAIGNLIRENKTFRITSAIQTGAKLGMILMDDALFKLWRDGKCAKQDVLVKAQFPEDLAQRIANAERGLFDDDEDVKRAATDDRKGEKKAVSS
jgi:hypothetical protein